MTVSRRTFATGLAWSVPVISVGAAAPLAAASGPCKPTLVLVPEESSKCCNGKVKNMKVTVKVTDTQNCGGTPGAGVFNILTAELANNGTAEVQIVGNTIYLLDASNCTVNLTVTYTFNGNTFTNVVSSNNLPTGNDDQSCQP